MEKSNKIIISVCAVVVVLAVIITNQVSVKLAEQKAPEEIPQIDLMQQREDVIRNMKCPAFAQRSPSMCYGDRKCQDNVYSFMAVMNNDVSACLNIQEEVIKQFCLAGIELNKGKCLEMEHKSAEDFCVALLDAVEKDDPESCNSLGDAIMDFAMDSETIPVQDVNKCKDSFYLFKALKAKDHAICGDIVDEGAEGMEMLCRALITGDVSICLEES